MLKKYRAQKIDIKTLLKLHLQGDSRLDKPNVSKRQKVFNLQ